MVRLGRKEDIPFVGEIFEHIHDQEEAGNVTIGWERGVYPTVETAREMEALGELYVVEEDGNVIGAARFNQEQVDVYADVPWEFLADDSQVLVLHTMVIEPSQWGKGVASQFLQFYEELAREMSCITLRIDTNERNEKARAMYRKYGYREAGIIPCCFNGIPGVNLVCLEKSVL